MVKHTQTIRRQFAGSFKQFVGSFYLVLYGGPQVLTFLFIFLIFAFYLFIYSFIFYLSVFCSIFYCLIYVYFC